MIHKIYWCVSCKAAGRDEAECLVCNNIQLEIGWIEITGDNE